MSHILIIIDGANELQGENITGAGILETLKGLMPTVETCENQTTPRSNSAQAVVNQSIVVADLFENGFTTDSLYNATTALQTAVNNYLNSEN